MDGAAQCLLFALMLVLPLSALVTRRPPLGQALKFALAWVGIFAVAVLLFGFRDRLPSLSALTSDQEVVGGETRIVMDPEGHFHVRAAVNGVERRMLVDSGAMTTSLSEATAHEAGTDPDDGFPVMIDTANGTVEARHGEAEALRVGSISAKKLRVIVSPAFGDTDVLGMDFLSRLKSWRVKGRKLVLTPG